MVSGARLTTVILTSKIAKLFLKQCGLSAKEADRIGRRAARDGGGALFLVLGATKAHSFWRFYLTGIDAGEGRRLDARSSRVLGGTWVRFRDSNGAEAASSEEDRAACADQREDQRATRGVLGRDVGGFLPGVNGDVTASKRHTWLMDYNRAESLSESCIREALGWQNVPPAKPENPPFLNVLRTQEKRPSFWSASQEPRHTGVMPVKASTG